MKLTVIVTILSVAFFLSQTSAQPPQWVSLDYDKYEFFTEKIDYQVCIMVPNPPSMKMVSPDDYYPKDACSEGKFFGYVLVSILPPLIAAFLVLVCFCCCCPCICGARYGAGMFGGGRPTAMRGVRGTILPGTEADALRAGYTRGEILLNKAVLGVLFIGLIAGGGLVLVSTQMITSFIWQAKNIFEQNPTYALDTVYATNQVLSSLNYTQNAAALQVQAQSMEIANKLQDTTHSEITDKLTGLSAIVQFVMDFTVACTFLLLIFALLAAMFHLPKCAIFLSLLVMPLMILVWIDLSVAYGANNIINKMCETINECHFCYTGQFPPHNNGSVDCHDKYCNVPWFMAMSNCTEEDASRFYGLENLIVNATTDAASVTCGQIAAICSNTEVKECAYPNGQCNSANLQAATLTGIVAIQLNVTPTVWQTVQSLMNNSRVSTGLSDLATDAVAQYSVVQNYAAQLTSVQTLDCSAGNAFIESDGGTFDALQKHLCPETNEIERTIHEILVLLAIGLIILGLLLPCVQCALCLGDKRFRRRARKTGGGFDGDHEETIGFVNAINATNSSPASRTGSIFD